MLNKTSQTCRPWAWLYVVDVLVLTISTQVLCLFFWHLCKEPRGIRNSTSASKHLQCTSNVPDEMDSFVGYCNGHRWTWESTHPDSIIHSSSTLSHRGCWCHQTNLTRSSLHYRKLESKEFMENRPFKAGNRNFRSKKKKKRVRYL